MRSSIHYTFLGICLLLAGMITGHVLQIDQVQTQVERTDSEEPILPEHTPEVPAKPVRTLVIIVPGTWGNDEFWNTVVTGNVTFASELLGQMDANTEIYPFHWSSGNSHDQRVAAAEHLTLLIQKQQSNYDRIHLIGHSHGGNICLLAVAKLSQPVETVVCLSTPHAYLRTKHFSGVHCDLPLYCSPQTLAAAKQVVVIKPQFDRVPELWADVLTGVQEPLAIQLAEPWREVSQFPKLAQDGMWFRLLRGDNLGMASELCLPCQTCEHVKNISLFSLVDDQLGTKNHHLIHSRRMGTLLGAVLQPQIQRDCWQQLESWIIHNPLDNGEPVPQQDYDAALQNLGEKVYFAGYWLHAIQIHCDAQYQQKMLDWDGSPPDFYVNILNQKQQVAAQSPVGKNHWEPELKIHQFLPAGNYQVRYFDDDRLSSQSFGGHELSIEPFAAACYHHPENYWYAEFKWLPVHY